MRYVKKPIVIEAFRYGFDEIPDWCSKNPSVVHCQSLASDHIAIDTLEGEMKAMPGDYIIKGIKGELYPCKADIFEASYNVAPDLIEEEFC